VKPPTVRLPYQRSHLPQSHCLSTRTYTSTRLTWLANDLLDQKGAEITDIVVVLTSNSNLPAALLLCCFCDVGGGDNNVTAKVAVCCFLQTPVSPPHFAISSWFCFDKTKQRELVCSGSARPLIKAVFSSRQDLIQHVSSCRACVRNKFISLALRW